MAAETGNNREPCKSTEERTDRACQCASALEAQGRYAEAVCHLEYALELEPGHTEALIQIADVYALYWEELALEKEVSLERALGHYDRALSLNPRLADAWAGKALVHLYQGNAELALQCAEQGLCVLPLREGFAMKYDPVFFNVSEALHDRRVRALLSLGRRAEARGALSIGFEACPRSTYLTRLIDEFE